MGFHILGEVDEGFRVLFEDLHFFDEGAVDVLVAEGVGVLDGDWGRSLALGSYDSYHQFVHFCVGVGFIE